MHVVIPLARYIGLKLHKTGYHVLVYYVKIINNTRNVDISPELGAVPVPEFLLQSGQRFVLALNFS
jgi:hypothetical protein